MPQPMQNLKDSSDPTTAMNKALALLAKAFKVNTISTNNNQRSSLIPRNSQIAQSGMNTSQDIKMQMVDDNVGNQYENGNVVTAPAEGNGNGINGNPIRCYNCRGEGHYASNCTVKSRKRDAAYLQQQLQIAQEEEAGIQSTQEEFEFMTTADALEETKRVKVNCTSEDTLQQASTFGTQSNNAPVYDSDGSTEYTDLQTDLDRTKEKLKNCIIKKEKEYAVLWNNWYTKCEECKYDKISYDRAYNEMQQRIERLQAQLGDLKVLGKPPSSSYKIKLYSVTPLPKSSVLPKMDKTNALFKPVTLNSAPSIQESKVVQTVNVIAPRILRLDPFKTSRVDNVVPNKPVKISIRIKPITISQPNVIHKQQANSDSNSFSSTRVNNTAKTRRPHP
ncbi:reverse transcriptase domain-containing protein [Tanacetum coccineum]